MAREPGVVSANIETDLDDIPSPRGLLRLASAFQHVGYDKLARYLRRCADALSAVPPKKRRAAKKAPR